MREEQENNDDETVTLVLALVTGTFSVRSSSWPLVDGSQEHFPSTAGVVCFSEACCCNEHLSWLVSIFVACGHWKGAGVPPWSFCGAPYRDVAHPSGGTANFPGKGGQPCALVPTN